MEFKSKKNINVVLIEPEIPNNTGNIGRTCVALEATLHLVGPLGFDLDEKKVRRAGLDYWPHLKLERYESQKEFFSKLPEAGKKAFFTTKAELFHYDCDFAGGDEDVWLIYGKETKGLTDDVLKRYPDDLYKIPMPGQTRSLNLANSVAIGAYEAFRQTRL
ncbi:MAG: tRNA (cytidine(34)-2'-O)-methyltransferase [Bdellovibrionales bacterium]